MGSPPPTEAEPAAPPPAAVQVQVVRKFPAPCWSQDETLALIHAYQDKWFSLRRRNLRTADWEAVADEVNRRCPNQSPPKTSAQCRHKMEKLRKRYRTEKQRISNLPIPMNNNHNSRLGLGIFPASSWVFFDLMDAMEIGSAPGSTNTHSNISNINVLNPNSNSNSYPPKENLNLNHKGGFVKEEKVMRGKEDLGKYFDDILMSVGKGPIKFKLNNNNNVNNSTAAAVADNDDNRFFDDDVIANNNSSTPAGFDYRNFASASASASRVNHKRKMSVNGLSFKKAAKRTGCDSASAVGDMVASINMLGDGLLKMEKMKMEMMQDLQRQRMQMELHNTKILLDSQHSILTAFLQGFTKLKRPPPCNPTSNY